MRVKIEDCLNVIGRGTIVVCTLPDELLEYVGDFTYVSKIKMGDVIVIEGEKYDIRGVEKMSSSKKVGLIIRKQDNIDTFVGKEFEI